MTEGSWLINRKSLIVTKFQVNEQGSQVVKTVVTAILNVGKERENHTGTPSSFPPPSNTLHSREYHIKTFDNVFTHQNNTVYPGSRL